MISFRIARSARRFRFNATLGYVMLLLFVGYVLALTQLQRSTEKTYAELRRVAPDRYLSEIRQAEGFRVYLREFRTLKGYDTPDPAGPAIPDRPLGVD